MNTKKSIVLTVAIAIVFLIAAVGSASAVTVINSCDFDADTQNEHYVLGRNLTCSGSEHGIIIGADGVVIDGYNETACGGKCWINGGSPISHAWAGVYDYLHDNIVIKNLEVKQFRNGIYLKGDVDEEDRVENVTIENCVIHDNGGGSTTQGIRLLCVCNSTIKGCEIYNQTGIDDGCEAGGDGIFLIGDPGSFGWGRNNTFTDNKIHDNRKGGIFIKGSPDYNNISYNKLWENGEASAGETGGIILRCKQSSSNTIEHNNVSNNVGDGIYIGGANNSVRYNNVTSNRDSTDDTVKGIGLKVQRCGEQNWGGYPNPENNTIYNNRFCYNEYKDIDVVSDCEAHVNGDDNTCDWTQNYNDAGTTGCTYRCMLAYRKQVDAKPPTTCNVPNTEFTDAQYDNIESDDGTRQNDYSTSQYATHRFNFSVIWNTSDINKINVTWNGKGYHDDGSATQGATLYLWNKTKAGYDNISYSTTNSGNEITFTYETTSASDINKYINGGNVTVLVEQNTAGDIDYSKIETDYVRFKLEIDP